jgi:hypothetical protein
MAPNTVESIAMQVPPPPLVPHKLPFSRALDFIRPVLVHLAKRVDPASRERVSRSGLMKTTRQRPCMACDPVADRRPWPRAAAHITPVDEGGETAEHNLVPLCTNDAAQAGRPVDCCEATTCGTRYRSWLNGLGCHELFDRGGASRQQMLTLALQSKRDTCVRSVMIEKLMSAHALGTEKYCFPKGRTEKPHAPASAVLGRPWADYVSRLRTGIAGRRLTEAWTVVGRYARHAETQLKPLDYAHWEYEVGYLYSLYPGGSEQALARWARSAEVCASNGDTLGALIAEMQQLVVTMLTTSKDDIDLVRSKWEARVTEVERFCEGAKTQGDPRGIGLGNRWLLNGYVNVARVCTKAGDMQGAIAALRRWQMAREASDITTGMTRFAGQTANVTFALVRSLEGADEEPFFAERRHRDEQEGWLARGIVGMGRWRSTYKRPEGIIDGLKAMLVLNDRCRWGLCGADTGVVRSGITQLSGLDCYSGLLD